jgi:hypothetical protein
MDAPIEALGAQGPRADRSTSPAAPTLRVASTTPDGSTASPPIEVSRRAQRWLDRLSELLPKLIPTDRVAGLSGLSREIAKLLRDVGAIELADLPGDDKVRIDGGRLLVHREYPELLARRRSAKRCFHRCALYVAHEVAHLAQGIGDKRRVVELRASEGEDTLLQVDLQADHAAAVFVAAILDEPLVALKQDSLEMLGAFPAGLGHSPGATLRKARRAVALAADVVGRRHDILQRDDEFAFVLWTRGGSAAGVYVQGSFTRHALRLSVTPEDAALFDSAASGLDRTKKVCKTLERAFRQALASEVSSCAS